MARTKREPHTNVCLWPNDVRPERPQQGAQLFRVGVRGDIDLRYRRKDRKKIAQLITKRVAGATVVEAGSNYLMVTAPEGSLAELEAVVKEINKKISACTEAEARGFTPPLFGTTS